MEDFLQRPTTYFWVIMWTEGSSLQKPSVFCWHTRSSIQKTSFCCGEITSVQALTEYMASMMSVSRFIDIQQNTVQKAELYMYILFFILQVKGGITSNSGKHLPTVLIVYLLLLQLTKRSFAVMEVSEFETLKRTVLSKFISFMSLY